jgi:hypothetical protein
VPWTLPLAQDIGAVLDAQTALLPASWNGAASTNGLPVDGPIFDRRTLVREFATGGTLILFGDASLDIGRSLTLFVKVMDDQVTGFGASARELAAWGPTTVVSNGLGVFMAGAPFQLIRNLNLIPARRFLRLTVTATLSGGGASQTIDIAGVFILGGQQQYPPRLLA